MSVGLLWHLPICIPCDEEKHDLHDAGRKGSRMSTAPLTGCSNLEHMGEDAPRVAK
jgi:hypothetical protein